MQRLLLLSLFLLGCTMLGAQPRIEFECTEYDAGSIAERGGVVSVDYRFTNTGDEPLLITDESHSCTCTLVDYPRKPILPGRTGVVTLRFNPRKQSGQVLKVVQLFTNETEGRQLLIFRGEVIPK